MSFQDLVNKANICIMPAEELRAHYCKLYDELSEIKEKFALTKKAFTAAGTELLDQKLQLEKAMELLDEAADAVSQDSYPVWWKKYRAFLGIEL